jgi:hypothetical protein
LDQTGQFTLLKSQYLRRVIHADLLKPLLDAMRSAGLIERDDHYVIGEKSYGYRLANRHATAPTIRIACRRPQFGHRIHSLRHQDFRRYKAVHKHLFHWLGRVRIDEPQALQVVDGRMSMDEVRDAHRLAVRMIADRQWEFRVCDYGRVHTNVTRLLRPLRRLLRVDGQPLVCLDAANSQPLFLLAALLTAGDRVAEGFEGAQKGDFGGGNPPFSPLLPYAMAFLLPPTADQGLAATSLPDDLQRYRDLCEEGRLYGWLMERVGWTAGKQAFKDQEVFRCLYGTNGDRDAEGRHVPSRLRPVMEAEFPTLWGVHPRLEATARVPRLGLPDATG